MLLEVAHDAPPQLVDAALALPLPAAAGLAAALAASLAASFAASGAHLAQQHGRSLAPDAPRAYAYKAPASGREYGLVQSLQSSA